MDKWIIPTAEHPADATSVKVPKPLTQEQQFTKEELAEMFYENKKGPRRTDFFPVYGDREGSYQADLVFIKPRIRGYGPCLTMIHINRRVAVAIPFKKKNAKNTANAMLKAIKMFRNTYNLPVKRIAVDGGTEFMADVKILLAKENVHLTVVHPSTGGKGRLGIIERFHRTMRRGINVWREMYKTNDWPVLIPYFLYKYNFENVHRSIGKPPMSMTDADERAYVQKKQAKTQDLIQRYNQRKEAFHRMGYTQTRHGIIRKDAFKKDGQRYSTVKYTATPNVGGRSYVLFNPQERLTRRYMPYEVSWVR